MGGRDADSEQEVACCATWGHGRGTPGAWRSRQGVRGKCRSVISLQFSPRTPEEQGALLGPSPLG